MKMRRVLAVMLSLCLGLNMGCVSAKVEAKETEPASRTTKGVDLGVSNNVFTQHVTLVQDDIVNAADGYINKDTNIGMKDLSLKNKDFTIVDSSGSLSFNITANGSDAVINSIRCNYDNGDTIILPNEMTLYYLVQVGDFGTDEEGNTIYQTMTINAGSQAFQFETKYEYKISEVTLKTKNLNKCLQPNNSTLSGNNYTIVVPDNVLEIPDSWASGNISIGKVVSRTATNIGKNAFANCTNLEVVQFDSAKVLGDSCFSHCITLGRENNVPVQIEFPVVQTVGKTAFQGCTSLAQIDLGSMLQSMDTGVFQDCVSLEYIDLTGGTPDGGTGTNTLSTLPSKCFSGCTNLKGVDITSRLVNIESECFYQCDMSNFSFETTKLQTIGSKAFQGCFNLKYACLPDTVHTVSKNAFSDCKNLRYIYSSNELDAGIASTGYTQIISGKKDTTAPDIAKAGSFTSVDGTSIFAGGQFVIFDDMNDVNLYTRKVSSEANSTIQGIKITRDGIDITSETPIAEVLDTSLISSGLMGYGFTVPDGQHGVYEVTISDVLGNKSTRTFTYDSDVQDNTPPTLNIEGNTLGSVDGVAVYGAGAKLICEDDLSLGSVLLNDEKQQYPSGGLVMNTDGKFNVKVIDSQGNGIETDIIIDGTNPVINGIADGDVTAKNVTIKVEDANLRSVHLNNTDITADAGSTRGYSVLQSGSYTVTAVDYAGNKTEISFIYSNSGAQFKGITNNAYYNKNVKVDWVSYVNITEATYTLDKTTHTLTKGMTFSKQGTYSLYLKDELGKSVKCNFTIDKTKPQVDGVSNGKSYNKGVTIKVVEDSRKYTMKVNGKTGTSTSFREDGKYTVVVTDQAGNSITVKFNVDTKAPTCNIKAKSKKGTKIKAKDTISGIKYIKLNGKKVKNGTKLKKKGKNKLVICDKAGNKKTITTKVK